MNAMLPSSRPALPPDEVRLHLMRSKASAAVAVLAIRGYYLDSLGRKGENDRAIYDDAICVISPTAFATFNANTDPSITRKGVAVLKPGVWNYKPGIHGLSKPKAQQYRAFVQAGAVTVARDDQGDDTGWFGINIHRGGNTTTSSLGCQTIPPAQWEAFRALLEGELKRHNQKTFPYALMLDPRLA